MVAILYCFMTSEVQTELRKLMTNWRWRQGLPSIHVTQRKLSNFQSNGTQLTTYTANSTSHQNTRASLSNDGIGLSQTGAAIATAPAAAGATTTGANEDNGGGGGGGGKTAETRRVSGSSSSSGRSSGGDSAYDSAPRRQLLKTTSTTTTTTAATTATTEQACDNRFDFENIDETSKLRSGDNNF